MTARPRDFFEDALQQNFDFYEALWTRSRVISPERFNTWPLVQSLAAKATRRLEVAPGLRPRFPLLGTHFIDVSDAAVAKLRRLGAEASVGLVSRLPFPDRSFELLGAFDIIEHVDDEAALSELSRVAAPGSTLLLSAPLHASRWTSFDDLVGPCRRYQPEELVAKLAGLGWSVDSTAVYGMQPRSSRLLDFSVWQLKHRRDRAIWLYDRIILPLAAMLQPPLDLQHGTPAALLAEADEVLLVCKKS